MADEYPEIVEELTKIADEARKILGDDLLDLEGSEVRPCGRVGGTDSVENLAIGKNIEIKYSPAKKYKGQGPNTLIDGALGSFDFHDGKWLGFRGDDLELTIDLGEKTSIHSINSRFLLNQTSWIFLPGEVEILISDDNRNYKTIFHEFYQNDSKDLQIEIREIGVQTEVNIRYIKIKAKNIGPLPDWHPGKNETGWLFVDEIVIY